MLYFEENSFINERGGSMGGLYICTQAWNMDDLQYIFYLNPDPYTVHVQAHAMHNNWQQNNAN